MPLAPGNSNAVKSQNIRELRHSGYPQQQSIAIALSNARRHPRKSGGENPRPQIKPGYLPPSMFPPLSVEQVARALPQAALTPLHTQKQPDPPPPVPQFGDNRPLYGGYAHGGRMGYAGGGTTVANSSIPALTADQAAQFPSMPAVASAPPVATTPQPFSNAIGNVPLSALAGGAGSNGIIAPVSNQGVPMGQPSAPTTFPNTAFAPPAPTPASTSTPVAGPQMASTSSGNNPLSANVPESGGFSTTGPGNGVVQFGAQDPTKQFITGTGPNNTPVQIVNPFYQPPTSVSITAKQGGAIPQFAAGGMPPTPWYAKAEARDELHTGGLFHGSQPGRADKSNVSVPADSHVIPADIVAAIGQGNTLAGGNILTGMFHSGPMGLPLEKGRGTPELRLPAAPHPFVDNPRMEASGGRQPHGGQTVPIAASSGEFNVNPAGVYQRGLIAAQNMKLDPARLGHDKIMELGHDILDKFILKVRKNEIKTLKKLPPPAKD